MYNMKHEQIKKWRRALHAYDPPDLEDNEGSETPDSDSASENEVSTCDSLQAASLAAACCLNAMLHVHPEPIGRTQQWQSRAFGKCRLRTLA